MPFELGLAVAAGMGRRTHQWFAFEARSYRVLKTLSDLNGYEAFTHSENPVGVLREIGNAFSWRGGNQPTTADLKTIYRGLQEVAPKLKRQNHTASVYDVHVTNELMVAARLIVEDRGI